MGKVISFNNIKGGSGKTATSIIIAKGLSDCGNKVLLIDLDLQGNTSSKFVENYEDVKGMVEVINDGIPLKEVICKTKYKNLDVVPTKLQWWECIEKLSEKDHIECYNNDENRTIHIIDNLLFSIKEDYCDLFVSSISLLKVII